MEVERGREKIGIDLDVDERAMVERIRRHYSAVSDTMAIRIALKITDRLISEEK